jgi:hypothetical protein
MWLPLCRLYPEISNECEPCSVTAVQIDRVLVLVLVGVDIWSQAPATRTAAAIYRSCRVLGTSDEEEGFVLPLLR